MTTHQRETQEQAAEQAFVPVLGAGSGVGFSKGVMLVNGRTQRPVTACDFDSTNGLTTYTAVIWQDPITGERRTSCNCPAWTIMRGPRRTCSHTEALEAGSPTVGNRRSRTNPRRVKQIHTVQEAVEAIPGISDDGRLLRVIEL